MKKTYLFLIIFSFCFIASLLFIASAIYAYFKIGLPESDLAIGILFFGACLVISLLIVLESVKSVKKIVDFDFNKFRYRYKIIISLSSFILGLSSFIITYALLNGIEAKIFGYATGAFFCYGAIKFILENSKPK